MMRLSKFILFWVTTLFWFSLYAYIPYVNPQLIGMGVTASIMGIIGGSYGFTQFALRIPVGIYSDKWQKKFFICAGCLCAGLAALCMLLFHNPIGFLIGRALGGVAASSWVPCTVLYASYSKPEHATRSMTSINLASQVGRLLSFMLAAYTAANLGVNYIFIIGAAGGFLGFILSLFIKENSTAEKKPITIKELISVGTERNLLITSVLTVFVQLIGYATYVTFTANHAVYIGATPSQLGYVKVILYVPSIILSILLSEFILKHVRAKYLVVLGFATTTLYCLLVPLTQTIQQLYAVQLLGGISVVLTLSLLMGLSVQNISTENRGAAMGFFQSLYGMGMAVGPLLMGALIDGVGLTYSFFFMATLAALSMVVSGVYLQSTPISKGAVK